MIANSSFVGRPPHVASGTSRPSLTSVSTRNILADLMPGPAVMWHGQSLPLRASHSTRNLVLCSVSLILKADITSSRVIVSSPLGGVGVSAPPPLPTVAAPRVLVNTHIKISEAQRLISPGFH